jgi:hypothetical protein
MTVRLVQNVEDHEPCRMAPGQVRRSHDGEGRSPEHHQATAVNTLIKVAIRTHCDQFRINVNIPGRPALFMNTLPMLWTGISQHRVQHVPVSLSAVWTRG